RRLLLALPPRLLRAVHRLRRIPARPGPALAARGAQPEPGRSRAHRQGGGRMTVLLAASPLSQPFFQHALLAGTAIAVASGLIGYFLVLRAQVFTADALSHVAFTGAMAALAFGPDLRL